MNVLASRNYLKFYSIIKLEISKVALKANIPYIYRYWKVFTMFSRLRLFVKNNVKFKIT